MTQKNHMSRLHMAIIIEENGQGFHRESLWYGGTPANLGLMIIDVMKDWYEPNKAVLNSSIISYHKMLEDGDALTFQKLAGCGFDTGGMKLFVKVSNDINDMFNFVVNEICNIFAKNGEKITDFKSLAEFRAHFKSSYDLDEGLAQVLEGVNEATISKALYIIDIKYDFTGRYFRNGLN